MNKWSKVGLCNVCHHRLSKHAPKCARSSCPCHYDHEKEQHYIVRRTLLERLRNMKVKLPSFEWPANGGFPACIVIKYGPPGRELRDRKTRPLTDKEKRWLQTIDKKEQNLCERLQQRIYDLKSNAKEAAEKSPSYISTTASPQNSQNSDLSTNPRGEQPMPRAKLAKAYSRPRKKSIPENEHKMKRRALASQKRR